MELKQYNFEDTVRYEMYNLDRLRRKLSIAIPVEYAEGLDLNLDVDTANRITLLIKHECFGERRQEKVDVAFEMPRSWFQHLKKTVLPSFLLKFWPIKTTTFTKVVKLDRSWVMPNIPLTSPETRTFWVRDNHKIL